MATKNRQWRQCIGSYNMVTDMSARGLGVRGDQPYHTESFVLRLGTRQCPYMSRNFRSSPRRSSQTAAWESQTNPNCSRAASLSFVMVECLPSFFIWYWFLCLLTQWAKDGFFGYCKGTRQWLCSCLNSTISWNRRFHCSNWFDRNDIVAIDLALI